MGFTKSSLIRIRSFGRLSVTVMRPSPTSSLPAQMKTAPSPERGPSNVALALGSSLAQGDQASQLWKSFTCANTRSGGAATAAVRATRYSLGCMATTMRKTTTSAANPRRIFLSIAFAPVWKLFL